MAANNSVSLLAELALSYRGKLTQFLRLPDSFFCSFGACPAPCFACHILGHGHVIYSVPSTA